MIQKRKVNTDRLQTKNVSDKLNSAKSKSEHENFIKAWNERIRSIHNLQEVNFMVVQHNLTAINANRYYGINNNKLSKSLEKLSSGYAINRAGDNAAGLAVSEKMRAQISGLSQATKNAQDGISMVQTFEGALTETDSILQRMRSLAVQSANGTYQNDVDREAIQLEFDQLNDELNQISDTDFNGVVVLNGGEMADGTKAVNGEFKYVANDPRTEAKQLGSSNVNTVDTKGYNGNSTAANDLWTALGLTDEESVELTLTYDKAADSWSITDSDSSTALANKANVTVSKGATATKNNGGFALTANGNEISNVVLDSTQLVNGDKVTLKFTKPVTKNSAPENIGVKDGTLVNKVTTTGSTATIAAPTLTVNGGGGAGHFESTNIADGDVKMTEEAAKAFNGLDGATFEFTTATAATGGTVESNTLKMTLADGKTVSLTADGTTTTKTGSIVSEDGVKYNLSLTQAGELTISDANNNELTKVTLGTLAGADKTKSESFTTKFEIALDTAVYSDATEPEVSIVEPAKTNKVSQSDSNNASTATLTYKDNVTLQVGARTKDSVNFTFSYESNGLGDLKADLDCSARGLGTDKLSLATQEDANAAIDKIDNAINKVSMVRGTFGAMQNRLEHKIDNLNTTNENLTAAESRIRDTNMAEEMMNFTKNQILSQASQSMLAQANQLPQSVLQLLQ